MCHEEETKCLLEPTCDTADFQIGILFHGNFSLNHLAHDVKDGSQRLQCTADEPLAGA